MIEYELKYCGPKISQAFNKVSKNRVIDRDIFETKYYDDDNKLQRAGYSLRVRDSGVELKSVRGAIRTEVGIKTKNYLRGIKSLLGMKEYNLPKINLKNLRHNYSTITAREAFRTSASLPRGVADLELCFDSTDFYKMRGGSYECIGEDEELEVEVLKMTKPCGKLYQPEYEDLTHLQNWFQSKHGLDIGKQNKSKFERATLYDEIALRVG